ncbi:hypothetical protein [Chryseobacterium koreense]|uniref:hypothetical protein n=1 Tax=Chryseobacterium koreense TaxID=232216 RepID=UPI0026EAD98A|nr:hypothetical protein [Chryseobacterium koreense]
MKYAFLFFLAFTFLISCRKEDETPTNKIAGEYKLVQTKSIFTTTGEPIIVDYSQQNIIYNFSKNNVLTVSGSDNYGYNPGTYPYEFKHDYLSGTPLTDAEIKIDFVLIGGGSKMLFSSSGNQMKLISSYVDGTDLIFEKK